MSVVKKPPLDEADVSSWVWKEWFNKLWKHVDDILGSGISLITQEEGVDLSSGVTTMNFVGTGVTASGGGTTTTVTIPGSGITLSGTPADNQIALWTSASNLEGSSLFTWDGSNFGIGVVSEAWTSATSIDLGTYGGLSDTGANIGVHSNLYYISPNWKYRETAAASLYGQSAGAHLFYTVASGTADNTATLVDRLRITLAGHAIFFAGTERAWDTGTETHAIQFYARSSLAERSGTSYFLNNTYFNGTNWIYAETAAATNVTLGSGLFQVRQAVSGTAGNAITWSSVILTNVGGSVAVGLPSLATTATDGFLCLPTCAGTPTGVPTAFTGFAQMVYDTTNNLLYVYDGAAWNLVA